MDFVAIALGVALTTAPTQAGEPTLSFMRGLWRGEGHMLFLDTERMQGNIATDKPFQRDAITVRNIAGRMVTFDVGTNRYIGLFEGNELQLSGGSLDKVVKLHRISPR